MSGHMVQETENRNRQGNRPNQVPRVLVLAFTLLPVALCGCGGSVGTNNTNTTISNSGNNNAGRTSLSSDDRAFMAEAATGGLMEVELGRLAVEKAQSADAKHFGQKMVDDHSRANDELKRLAAAKGVTLPADLTDEQKAERDKLAKLSGAEFDHAYMGLMVEDHDKDVKAFQNEASNATDPDLRAFAAKTLPTLQEHQRMAHEIHAKH